MPERRQTTLWAFLLMLGLVSWTQGPSASAQEAKGPISGIAEKLNPMNWKMPSMKPPGFRLPNFLVANEDQDRIVQRKNGLMDDMKGTASKSWQRTKEVFNPARLNPMNMFAGGANKPAGEKSPGFFSSLLGGQSTSQPEERVASVNEFLGQQRPTQ